MEILFNCCFKKIYDVAVVCDGNAFLGSFLLFGQLENFIDVIENYINPALIVSCLNSGVVSAKIPTACAMFAAFG